MNQKPQAQRTEKWLFRLQQEQTLQFHIASEQGTVLIEGHEISILLDYLYTHRDLIYDATHDQELRALESQNALAELTGERLQEALVEPVRYVDNGIQRTRTNS